MAFGLGGIPVIGDIYNSLRGNPDAVKAAYDQMMNQAGQMGRETRDFLMQRQQNAQKFYAPIQGLFQNMYGTQGIQAPQVPQGTAGMGNINQMMRGR